MPDPAHPAGPIPGPPGPGGPADWAQAAGAEATGDRVLLSDPDFARALLGQLINDRGLDHDDQGYLQPVTDLLTDPGHLLGVTVAAAHGWRGAGEDRYPATFSPGNARLWQAVCEAVPPAAALRAYGRPIAALSAGRGAGLKSLCVAAEAMAGLVVAAQAWPAGPRARAGRGWRCP